MRPYSPLFIIASLIWVLGGSFLLSKWVCGAGSTVAADAGVPGFSVSHGEFETQSVALFSFPANSDVISLEEETNFQLQNIATYLANNPDLDLVLEGTYGTKEKNDTDYENLGIARASAVKRLLVEMGATGENIITEADQTDNVVIKNDILFGGVDFLIGAGGNNADEAGESGNTFSLTKAYIIPYEGNSIEMEMTDAIQDYLDKTIAHLNANPGAQLVVYGHTDNSGNRQENFVTAEKIAQKVRRFFRNNGLSSSQVKAISKGSDEPITSNFDEEGRKENRRVELKIE